MNRVNRAKLVGDGGGINLGDHSPFGQGLCQRQGIVQRIGPQTRGGIDRHRAIVRRTGNRPGLACTRIHVIRGELARDRGRARYNRGAIVGHAGFGDSTRHHRRSGNHRRVIGAGNGDGDGLGINGSRTVGHGHGINLCDGLACRQIVNQTVLDIEVPGDRTCTVCRGGIADARHKRAKRCRSADNRSENRANRVAVGQINIAEVQRPRAVEQREILACHKISNLGHSACGRTRRDDRCIIGAGNGDGDGLGINGTRTVGHGHGINLCDGLACRQIVNQTVLDIEVPGDRTCTVCRGGIADARHKRAKRCRSADNRSENRANRVAVGQINIAEVQRPRAVEQREILACHKISNLGHSACGRTRRDDRCIIGAGDGDGDGIGVGKTLLICNCDHIGLR